MFFSFSFPTTGIILKIFIADENELKTIYRSIQSMLGYRFCGLRQKSNFNCNSQQLGKSLMIAVLFLLAPKLKIKQKLLHKMSKRNTKANIQHRCTKIAHHACLTSVTSNHLTEKSNNPCEQVDR